VKRTILLFFQIFILFQIVSQEIELSEKHDEILKNILKMNIAVRIYNNEQKLIWDIENSKLTIPGKAVNLKLEGLELKIYGIFTVYQVKDAFMLLAQSQVILLPPSTVGFRYYNSVKTLSIHLNESIFFFPLGQKEDTLPSEEGIIEIELQLVPYIPPKSEKAGSGD